MDSLENKHSNNEYDICGDKICWDKYSHYSNWNCGDSCRCCLAAKQIRAEKQGYCIYVHGACTICLNNSR